MEGLLSTGPTPSSLKFSDISGSVTFLMLVIFEFWEHFHFEDIYF